MPVKGDGLVFGEVIEGDFIVTAGEENIGVVLVDIDDVHVLVGVKFVGVLVGLFHGVVLVLEDEAVGVGAVEEIVEGFDLVEYGEWAGSEVFGEVYFDGFGRSDAGLLLNHLIVMYIRVHDLSS